MLAVSDCVADYGRETVLGGITFDVRPGEVAAVIGPSGCGKSTLLAVLAGLKAPSRGAVLLDGSPPSAGDGRIGLILQSYGLFPWMTAARNVRLALELRRPPLGSLTKAAVHEAARRSLEQVGLAALAHRYPSELSGGQQQRVAIARTLAREPELLLMDEPFSSLDALSREELQDLALSLLGSRRAATVLVTHSIEEAVYMSSTVLIMSRGPGSRIVAADSHAETPGGYSRTSPTYFHVCRRVRIRLAEVLREG
jgi:ABC-type nitrate/sulfonate/bicarbonate transport system ATPase subunit